MSLSLDGQNPDRWSHAEISTWLDADGNSVRVTIGLSSISTKRTIDFLRGTQEHSASACQPCPKSRDRNSAMFVGQVVDLGLNPFPSFLS